MDPHPEIHGKHVAPMCTTCSQACEGKQGRWVCVNCNRPYEHNQGDLQMVTQDKPTTCGNGVVLQPLSGTQEPGHQALPPCLPQTADEDEGPKVWVS
jgi:hypothetical protein